MSNSEKLKLRLKGVREDFQRFDGDTGSSEVQGILSPFFSQRRTHLGNLFLDPSSFANLVYSVCLSTLLDRQMP